MGCFVCIHCHFYQPPRENPWLEAVESQDSASPYHDWNERITAECYLPNGASRMLDGHGRLARGSVFVEVEPAYPTSELVQETGAAAVADAVMMSSHGLQMPAGPE